MKSERQELLEILDELVNEVPMMLDHATVPPGRSADMYPDQAVVNMSVSWSRILRARAAVAKAKERNND